MPCHRVIGTNGTLTGFGGGIDRKRTLLALESPGLVLRARLRLSAVRPVPVGRLGRRCGRTSSCTPAPGGVAAEQM
ncbi:MAG: MGMT family protein [Nocardioidaceae bacterium]